MLKVNPHLDYPPEEGRYLRGIDFSPVAVVIILNCGGHNIPLDIENRIRAGKGNGDSPFREYTNREYWV